MKVKNVRGWVCPSCDEFHPLDEETIPVPETRYQCGVCEEIYEDKDSGKECCKE